MFEGMINASVRSEKKLPLTLPIKPNLGIIGPDWLCHLAGKFQTAPTFLSYFLFLRQHHSLQLKTIETLAITFLSHIILASAGVISHSKLSCVSAPVEIFPKFQGNYDSAHVFRFPPVPVPALCPLNLIVIYFTFMTRQDPRYTLILSFQSFLNTGYLIDNSFCQIKLNYCS